MSFKIDTNKHPIKTAPDATTYQLLSTDYFYVAFSGQTINLPDPSIPANQGRVYYIKLGSVHTADVTIQCVHGPTTYNIDGAASDFITKSWGVLGVVAGQTTAGVSQWLLVQHIDKNI